MKNVKEPGKSSSLNYLRSGDSAIAVSDLSNEGLLEKWRRSVYFLVREASARLRRLQKEGLAPEHAWNQCSVALVKCAKVSYDK